MLYGWLEHTQKFKSWALLTHLATFVDGPWLCIGDFNAILHTTEKQSARPPSYIQMDEFYIALERCNLADLGFLGYPFTWNNKRPGHANTRQRLDRAVANAEWRLKFPATTVTHLFSHASNHLPIILQVMIDRRKTVRSKKGFKFEEVWLMWDDCEEVGHEAWNTYGGAASALDDVKEKIKRCGDLQAWGAVRSNLDTERIKALEKQVELITKTELIEATKADLAVVSKELDDLLLKQEIFWAQQSRVSWLKYGDKNTKFHSKASQRRRRNFIHGIRNSEDAWLEEIDDIADMAVNYFENMFKSGACDRLEECLAAVPYNVTSDMQIFLTGEYSAEKIKAALFQMGSIKAPRPNGMNTLFYQKLWHIVGDNVVNAILEFLNTGHMEPDLNYTHIVLIPKIKSPEKMSDYRPIKLCNVIYKIISKVLANRLKQILPQLIAPSQSAFVPGCLITDNVLVAYETLHAMHCQKKGKK